MPRVYRASATLMSQELERGTILNDVVPIPPSERLDTMRIKIESRNYMKDVADMVNIAEYLRSIGKPSDLESTVKYLRRIVTVRPRGGRLIEISAMHPIPTMAKRIADAVAHNYEDRTLLWRQSATSDTVDFMEDQIQVYWQRVQEAEEALVKAQEKSPLGYLSEEASGLVSQAAKHKTDLFETELDLQDAKNELQKVKDLMENPLAGNDGSKSASHLDPELVTLQSKLSSLQTQYEQLSVRYSDNYPQVRRLKIEIAQVENDLEQAKARFSAQQQDIPLRLQYWQDRVTTLEARKTALEDKAGEYERKLQLLPERQLELARLQREKSIADNGYTMLLSRLDALRLRQISEAQNMGRVAEVLDEAIEPDVPVKPNKKKIAILALGMGVMIGFGSAFLLEYFDRSFRSVDEVSAYLGIPVLAAIPMVTTPESELKRKRRKLFIVACIGAVSFVVLVMLVDIATAEFLNRESFFLSIARSVPRLLRFWLRAYSGY